MEITDFGSKLDSIFAAEHPDSSVQMYFILALRKDGSRLISQRVEEPLIEVLHQFLKEVERSI